MPLRPYWIKLAFWLFMKYQVSKGMLCLLCSDIFHQRQIESSTYMSFLKMNNSLFFNPSIARIFGTYYTTDFKK